MQKQDFLAEKGRLWIKKLVNLPNIVALLSNTGKYAKINNKVVFGGIF